MGLKENIRKLRSEKGWSQTDLAKKIGIHLTHINRIEKGKINPSLDVAAKIAEALEVSLDYLISEDEGEFKEVKIEDKSLAQRIKLLNTLDPEDRNVIIRVIDSMLTKQKMKKLVNTEFAGQLQ